MPPSVNAEAVLMIFVAVNGAADALKSRVSPPAKVEAAGDTTVGPLYVFEPESVVVPPVIVRPEVPLMSPEALSVMMPPVCKTPPPPLKVPVRTRVPPATVVRPL